jgi:anti-sigma factor RsiW
MRNKLGAYLDGELDQRSLMEVEGHLAICQSCQAELEELRQLSSLLHAAPKPDFISALDFKNQLMLQLPRRAEMPPLKPNGHVLLWMAPVLILAGWIFIQVTISLSTLLIFANQAGFLDNTAIWLASSSQQMPWFSMLQIVAGGILGPKGQADLELVNDAGLFVQNLARPLFWQVGVAVFYWGALFLAWREKVKPFLTLPAAE